MLNASTPQQDFITGRLAQFVSTQTKFYNEGGLNFLETPLSPACLIFDLSMALGLDESALREILGSEIVDEIA